MKIDRKKNWILRSRMRGFSLLELLIVLFVVMVIAAIVIPNILQSEAKPQAAPVN